LAAALGALAASSFPQQQQQQQQQPASRIPVPVPSSRLAWRRSDRVSNLRSRGRAGSNPDIFARREANTTISVAAIDIAEKE